MASGRSRERSTSSAWLYGPTSDLLIGCGGAYLLSVPVLLAVGQATGTLGWSTAVASLLALLVSGPHYGATLIRAYREREDRRKYRLFAVHVTLLLGVAYVVALRDVAVGSWLLTLYVSWSIWHFAGQNYGIALMMLRRRGVPIAPEAKRWFYASFVLSFALSFVLIHMEGSPYVLALGAETSESYRILRLGIPVELVAPIATLVGGLYALSLVASARLLLRGAAPRDLTPAVLIVLTQATWYTVPALVHVTRGASLSALPFTAVWISVAHAVQYLWVTSYYARRAAKPDAPARHLSKALMAGAAVTTLPALAFAPALLGGPTWDAGLAVMTFSVVNLHHFILDGAIWKLRHGRVARALLQTGPPAASRRAEPAWRGAGALLWSAGAACLAISIFGIWQAEGAASDDPSRGAAALERLRWVGRDSPELRYRVGVRYAESGELEHAVAQYRRSLALRPSADAWAALGLAHEGRGDWPAARSANAKARELDPGHAIALIHAADLALREAHDLPPVQAAREREDAAALLLRALTAHDAVRDPATRIAELPQHLERAGRHDDAARVRAVIEHQATSEAIRRISTRPRSDRPAQNRAH